MGYETLRFLGEDYQVPKAINEFLHYDELLTPIRIKMMQTLTQNIETDSRYLIFDGNTPDYVIRNTKSYIKLMEDGVTVLINELYTFGIYDVTASDLMENITCIEEINKLQMNILQTMLAEGKKYIEMKNAGMERAYRSSASNITGSGLMVFTNSITTLFIHSMVERSILLSQAKEADKVYEEAVKVINTSTQNALDSMVRAVMVKQYYPVVMNIIMDFNSKVMSNFLAELVEHGKFDFESIQNYNMDKAEQMLLNIAQVSDKISFLKQTFKVCPFCLSLYDEVLSQGLLDMDTFKTAEYFGFGDTLAGKLEAHIRCHLNDKSKIATEITILAKCKKTSELEIWRDIYKNRLERIEQSYRSIHAALRNRENLTRFVKENISSNMLIVAETSKEEVTQVISKVLSSILTNAQYSEFIEMGLLSPEKLRQSGSSAYELDQINTELKNSLIEAVMEYIEEANCRLKRYEQSQEQLDIELKQLRAELNAMQTKRERLGFFAVSQKKKMAFEIEEKAKAIREFENNHESKRLLYEFEHMN